MKKIGLLTLLLLAVLVVTVGTAIATRPLIAVNGGETAEIIETNFKPTDGSLAIVELSDGACVTDGAGALATGDEFVFSATAFIDGTGTGTFEHFTPVVEVPDKGNNGHGNNPDGCDEGNLGKKACEPKTTRNHFVGTVTSAMCVPDGVAFFGAAGFGTWNGTPGYTFDVFAQDSGLPPNIDFYEIMITAPDGSTITHFVSNVDVTSGDITTTVP